LNVTKINLLQIGAVCVKYFTLTDVNNMDTGLYSTLRNQRATSK
jgi:hypothetical protein